MCTVCSQQLSDSPYSSLSPLKRRQCLETTQPNHLNAKPPCSRVSIAPCSSFITHIAFFWMSRTLCHAESKLLVSSHVPKSSADLAVPKKKVGEVRDWLLADHGPSLLLLSGA